MWPWEHLAFGYLVFSGYTWVRLGRPPTVAASIVLVIATQLPDLVDKPLAWSLGILPTGTTLAHSGLTAIPLIAIGLLGSRRLGWPAGGSAFAVGYLSHLLGDVGYRLLVEDEPIAFLLWPLVPQADDRPIGFVSQVVEYLSEFGTFIGTARGVSYLLFELGLLASALFLWRRDQRYRGRSTGTERPSVSDTG